VDLHRGQHPLGRGDDDLLFTVRGVANDVHARHIRGLVVLRHHRSRRGELAPQVPSEIGSLLLACREEECRALERRATSELDALESAAATDQPPDRILSNSDAVAAAPRARIAPEQLSVCDEHDIFAPRPENESRFDPATTASVDRERSVRVLVRIAERTVMDASAIQRLKTRYRRELVHNAGRKNESTTQKCPTVVATHDERPTSAVGGSDRSGADVNGLVFRQLGPAELEELGRRCAVAREEAMRGPRGAISRKAVIDHDDASTATSQHESRGESCRTGADDHDVVRLHRRTSVSEREEIRGVRSHSTVPVADIRIRWLDNEVLVGRVRAAAMAKPEVSGGES
jgi:hypothetical protein